MSSRPPPANLAPPEPGPLLQIDIHGLFRSSPDTSLRYVINSLTFTRTVITNKSGISVLCDRFAESSAAVCFLRIPGNETSRASIGLDGGYHINTCAAGGWLVSPHDSSNDSFWIPTVPHLRKQDRDGHILAQQPAKASSFEITPSRMALVIDIPSDKTLDVTIWRIPSKEPDLIQFLQALTALERQHYFLWSSHTTYKRPADLYLHLIHGHIYEDHEVWPRYWRVCSELDAYALYVTITGLLRATGRRMYDLLRTQVVFSVIARQANDGGWYHGEWTDQMESHYRLHAGAMHLLAAYFEETRDPLAGASLEQAAAFAATKTDHLDVGAWYLHDSLEQDEETIEKCPFRHIPSRALGKSVSNLLVLNTHLDTNIAMERCRRVTGNTHHGPLIASANGATSAVLNLRPAEWLYGPLFRAIALTFLPTQRAKKLPLPLRAVKRIAWRYLVPSLPRIKAMFPRLVMPGGYIERELTMFAFSVRYQPVNLMDLIRTRRLFDNLELDTLLDESFAFTQLSGIKDRWKELKGKEDDSLGFWAEALYHLCLAKPDMRYRAWLAEAMLDLEDNGLGLSPSLLGANAEAVPVDQQRPCPIPCDARLRMANLSRANDIEVLIVNTSGQDVSLELEHTPVNALIWRTSDGTLLPSGEETPPIIPPRGWFQGSTNATRTTRP